MLKQHGKGYYQKEGWILDKEHYLVRVENNHTNSWSNLELHDKVDRRKVSHFEVEHLMKPENIFGEKMFKLTLLSEL